MEINPLIRLRPCVAHGFSAHNSSDQTDGKQHRPERHVEAMRLRVSTLLTLCVFSLLLNACDGGLFGTGDGDLDVVPPSIEDSPDSTPPGGEEDIVLPGSPSPDASGDQPPVLPFENLSPSGLNTATPLLKLINRSVTDIQLQIMSESVLSTIDVSSGSTSPERELSLMPNTVTLLDSASNRMGVIRPLTAADSTLTTLVLRKAIADAPESTNSTVLALTTRARSTVAGMSMVRLIQISSLATRNQTAQFTLSPVATDSADTTAPAEILFSNIDALNNPVTDYQLVDAGSYMLTDSLSRFMPEGVTIETDKVYTLLLTDDPESTVILEEDSDVSLP